MTSFTKNVFTRLIQNEVTIETEKTAIPFYVHTRSNTLKYSYYIKANIQWPLLSKILSKSSEFEDISIIPSLGSKMGLHTPNGNEKRNISNFTKKTFHTSLGSAFSPNITVNKWRFRDGR